MFNGVFLLSLCLYIVLECIPELIHASIPWCDSLGSSHDSHLKNDDKTIGLPATHSELHTIFSHNKTDACGRRGTNYDSAVNIGAYFYVGVAFAGLLTNTLGTVIFWLSGQEHGHSHSHGHGHGHAHGHGDDHKGKSKKAERAPLLGSIQSDDHGHGHGHGDEHEHDHGHDHGHAHDHHDASLEKKKPKFDMNTWAVLIHYAGDMLSSFFVLCAGLLMMMFPEFWWTKYIDALASLAIVVLILWSTVPLVLSCSRILLQSTPKDVDLEGVRREIFEIHGVLNSHDLHIWQLTEGTYIASVHLAVEEGSDFNHVVRQVKAVMHKHNIHSTCVQPEFIPRNHPTNAYCETNCVEGCEQDWCCEKVKKTIRRSASNLGDV